MGPKVLTSLSLFAFGGGVGKLSFDLYSNRYDSWAEHRVIAYSKRECHLNFLDNEHQYLHQNPLTIWFGIRFPITKKWTKHQCPQTNNFTHISPDACDLVAIYVFCVSHSLTSRGFHGHCAPQTSPSPSSRLHSATKMRLSIAYGECRFSSSLSAIRLDKHIYIFTHFFHQ